MRKLKGEFGFFVPTAKPCHKWKHSWEEAEQQFITVENVSIKKGSALEDTHHHDNHHVIWIYVFMN